MQEVEHIASPNAVPSVEVMTNIMALIDAQTKFQNMDAIRFLKRNGRWMFKKRDSSTEACGTPQACFDNALDMARKTGMRVIVGFAVADDVPIPISHAANLTDDDVVIDTTPGWSERDVWYFVVVPASCEVLATVKMVSTPANPNNDLIDAWRFLNLEDRRRVLSAAGVHDGLLFHPWQWSVREESGGGSLPSSPRIGGAQHVARERECERECEEWFELFDDATDIDGHDLTLEHLFEYANFAGRTFCIKGEALHTAPGSIKGPVVHALVQRSRGPRGCVPMHLYEFVRGYESATIILQQISVRPDARGMGICTSFLRSLRAVATRLQYNILVQAVLSGSLLRILQREGFHSVNPPHEAEGGDFGWRAPSNNPFPPTWDLHKTVVFDHSVQNDGADLPNFDQQGDDFLNVEFIALDSKFGRQRHRIADVAEVKTMFRRDGDEASMVPPRPYAGSGTPDHVFLPARVMNGYRLKNSVMDSTAVCGSTRGRVSGVLFLLA